MRSLTTEVIRHGRITTTLARAKAIRGSVRSPTCHFVLGIDASVDLAIALKWRLSPAAISI
jgi:hypothetical protein